VTFGKIFGLNKFTGLPKIFFVLLATVLFLEASHTPAAAEILKICKVAGEGVDVGTPFTFDIDGTDSIVVPAGPPPGGYCAVYEETTFPVGATIEVQEIGPQGYEVTDITVSTPAGPINLDLDAKSVEIEASAGIDEVTFTNTKNTGYLEICKEGDVTGDFEFMVNPGSIGPITVPSGACSPAIEVPAGLVQIKELSAATVLTGCHTIPAHQQDGCDLENGVSTVNVDRGGIAEQTIAFITNGSSNNISIQKLIDDPVVANGANQTGFSFEVILDCGTAYSGSHILSANQTVAIPSVPAGTMCTVSETVAIPTVAQAQAMGCPAANYPPSWNTSITPNTFTAGTEPISVLVENELVCGDVQPELKLKKEAIGCVDDLADQCTYRIEIQNSGTAPHIGPLNFFDWRVPHSGPFPLIPPIIFDGWTSTPGGWHCMLNNSTGSVECQHPNVQILPGGIQTIDIVLSIPPMPGYSENRNIFHNCAGFIDEDVSTASCVEWRDGWAPLTISKELLPGHDCQPGSTCGFTITINDQNVDSGNPTNSFILNDTLFSSGTLVNGVTLISATNGWVCDDSSGVQIICNNSSLPPIPPGGEYSFDLIVALPNGPTPDENCIELNGNNLYVTPPPSDCVSLSPYDLAISKITLENTTDPAAQTTGDWINDNRGTFEISVENVGNGTFSDSALSNLIISDHIPAGVTVISFGATDSNEWNCSPPTPIVGPAPISCTFIGSVGTQGLEPGSHLPKIELETIATGGGAFDALTNCGELSLWGTGLGQDDLHSDNNVDCASIYSVTIVKELVGSSDDSVSFLVTVIPDSPIPPGVSVTISDALPPGFDDYIVKLDAPPPHDQDDFGNIWACATPVNTVSCSTMLQNEWSDDPDNNPVQFEIEADGLPPGTVMEPFENCVEFDSGTPPVVMSSSSIPCVSVN